MFLGDNFKDEDDENDDPESNKKISIEGQNLRDILTKKEKGKSEDSEKDDEENEDSEEEDDDDYDIEDDDDDDYDIEEEDDDELEDIAEGKDVNAEKKEIVPEYTSSDETKEENFEKDEEDEEDEEPTEEKIIELIRELANKMKAKGESKKNIKKCVAPLLLNLLVDYDNLDLNENDMKDLTDKLYENDLNSQNGEENPKKVTITDEKKSKKDSEKSRAIATQGTYGMATEDDMKDLTDNLHENDLNSQNDEENPKKDSEEATWQDDSDMDNDKAKGLRDEARDIATMQGEYGMATKAGIERLSELLNELLKYASGPFRKNKPIAELVRNFNSIKAIESQLVGNEKSLKIVASEKDLEKVAKSIKNLEEFAKSAKNTEEDAESDENTEEDAENDENPKEARMLRLSMEQTYADKIRALDRFKYSEKVETMIRNALFDLYENSKVVKIKEEEENGNYVYEEKLENEKAINIGKILLPLLRTKNEPKDYNYDFQYDVLREMIRQEEFYEENHDTDYLERGSGKYNNDNKKVKVTPVGAFAILRYLRTILNYTNEKIGNTDASASDLYKTECFKTNFVKTLQNIINNNSSTKDNEINDDNPDYQKYMRALQKIVEENKELGPALSEPNKIILSLYDKTKKYLKEKKNNIDLSDLKSSLRKLSETLDDFNQGNIIPKLYKKISRIATALSGNSDLKTILSICEYTDKEIPSIQDLDKELQQKQKQKKN